MFRPIRLSCYYTQLRCFVYQHTKANSLPETKTAEKENTSPELSVEPTGRRGDKFCEHGKKL